MKRKILLSLVGFACSFLVGMGVHYRSEAIRHSEPLTLDEPEGGSSSSKEDFVRDIQRIQYEVYDPIRPVSEEGSALLILEKAAYATPAAMFTALLSPTFLPMFAYPEQFHQDHRRRLPFGSPLPADIASLAQAEGYAWGIGQGVAFYLPFFIIPKKKTQPTMKKSEQAGDGDAEEAV